MEISLISDTLTAIATKYGHGLEVSNFVTHRNCSSHDQQLQTYALMVAIDSIAPPSVKPRAAPKKLARKRCRVKRSSKIDGGGPYIDEDGGGFFDGGDGPFGGGGGGGGGGNFDGFNWDESVPAPPSDPAFDFVYNILCWIVFSNCLHFAFKKVFRILADGVADPEREKVPLRFTPIMDCSNPNVVEKKKYKPKHVWNTDTTTYFIDMCLNEKLKGNKPGSHLNKAGWLNLEKAMLEKTGKVFDKKQLSNKWDGMKKDWKRYDRLMRLETGIGGTRSLIDVSKKDWKLYDRLMRLQRAQTPALRAPSGAKETFNIRHSSLRNIIERTFGVWKARWAILRDMHVNFTYDHQVKIVLASMAMHNYIRKAGIIDETFNTAQQESYDPTPCPNTPCPNTNGAQERPSRRPTGNEDSLWMTAYRDMIAEEIMNT